MRLFLTLFFFAIPGMLRAQAFDFEGTVLFFYNSHPSELITNESFFSLDSVRFFTSGKKYAVWADYSQNERFIIDTCLPTLSLGKCFKIWDSVPQYSSVITRDNIYHYGGDTYCDNRNEIVIAFFVNGEAYLVNPDKMKKSILKPDILSSNYNRLIDSTETVQTVWYDYRTFSNCKYLIFQKICKSKSLKKNQRGILGLKRKKIRKFRLYGN